MTETTERATLPGAELARASTIDGIGTIARKAVRDLIGQLPGREALFAMRRADELTVVATSSGRLAPSGKLAGLVPQLLPRLRLLEHGEPQLIPVTGLGPKEKSAASGAGFESILLCPLVLAHQPAGDPLIGLIALVKVPVLTISPAASGGCSRPCHRRWGSSPTR